MFIVYDGESTQAENTIGEVQCEGPASGKNEEIRCHFRVDGGQFVSLSSVKDKKGTDI
jgi:hypothetical protein